VSKFICLMLALVLLLNCFSFVACSGGGGQTASTASPTAAGHATPKPTTPHKGLTINDFSVYLPDYTYSNDGVWCSVSVVDSKGNLVTGLTGNSFKINEALLSPSGEVLEEADIPFSSPLEAILQPSGSLIEKSVTGEKLDIIFIADTYNQSDTGQSSMCDRIRSELGEFVNRLVSEHVDYRIGVSSSGSAGPGMSGFGFQVLGAMDDFWVLSEALGGTIQDWTDSMECGEGKPWRPSGDYNAVMYLASEFNWRPDARKVIVVITDSIPQTIYGCVVDRDSPPVTVSAMENFLKDSGIELLYSQDIGDKIPGEGWYECGNCFGKRLRGFHCFSDYADPNRNPRASDDNSGFEALRRLGLAKKIAWPFQQEDIEIAGGNIVQSQYYLSWVSQLYCYSEDSDCSKVRATIKVADPDRPGQYLEKSFSYTPGAHMETATLTIKFIDEAGNPTDDVIFRMYSEMGDIEKYYKFGLFPDQGQCVINDLPVGNKYLVTVVQTECLLAGLCDEPTFDGSGLTYAHRETIQVPKGGGTITIQVETIHKEVELAKARGLLTDLKNWGYLDKPFSDFADEATAWLDELEKGGVDMSELEAVMRFSTALGGYVNSTGYADIELEHAVADFVAGSKEARKLLQKLTDTSDNLAESLYDPVTLAELAGYVASQLVSPPSATAVSTYAIEEIATKAVLDYVKGPLMKEVIAQMVSTIPVSGNLTKVLKILMEAIVFKHWEDKDEVMQTVVELGLGAAQNEVNLKLTNVYENGKINDDAVIDVLARIFCEWIVLRQFYSDPLQGDLEDLLHWAQSFKPVNELDDRGYNMVEDFHHWSGTMQSIQTYALGALNNQDSIDDWETTLSTVSSALTVLQATTAVCCVYYPTVCDRVKDIDDMMSFVEAMKLLTNILQFGMKIDTIATIGDKVNDANAMVVGPQHLGRYYPD